MLIHDSHEKHTDRKAWLHSPYYLWLLWLVWLLFLIPPLVELFQLHPPISVLFLSLIGTLLFLSAYMWGTWYNLQHQILAPVISSGSRVVVWLPLIVLTTLSVVFVGSQGHNWNGLFIFTCAYVCSSLPFLPAAATVIVLAFLNGVVSRLTGASGLDILYPTLIMGGVSFTVIMQVQWIKTSQQLEAAREEIAHFAALEERLRIARDLHDLLGHNLSLITLKSELAGHFLEVDVDRTALATEIHDIEQVARTTLQEVREAVAGYRTPSLLRELREAEAMLTSASITYRFEGNMNVVQTLPTEISAVLAWAVREGVTNVVRHSQAQWCKIHIQLDASRIQLQIVNGSSEQSTTTVSFPVLVPSRSDSERSGSGLRGLNERLAAVGGKCKASAGKDGFCLTVFVPLTTEQTEERCTQAFVSQAMKKETEKL